MNVFITGGTGFVGTTLTRQLMEKGHHVTILTRKMPSQPSHAATKGVSYLEGDPVRPGPWQEQVSGHDTIINLAGASIFRKWNRKAKELIRDSRVLTTAHLVEAMSSDVNRQTTLISTSAVGYYGFREDEVLDEESPPGDDFLSAVTRDWEAAAARAETLGARVVICRFGIVLGKGGGALGEMVPLFQKGLGSPLGTGRQWFSWVHQDDLVRIYLFLMDRDDMSGPVNCTAPEPVTNRRLTRALGMALGKPTILPPVPGIVIRLMKGEFGTLLLKGQRVLPKKLLTAGFQFQFPAIQEALNDLLGRPSEK